MVMMIDTRLGSSAHNFSQVIVNGRQVDCEFVKLAFGDVCWVGNAEHGPIEVAAELKKIPDFIHSLESGRLTGHQLPGMFRNYGYSYLLVQGDARQGRYGQLIVNGKSVGGKQQAWRWVDYQSALNSLRVLGGVQVVTTRDDIETAGVLTAMYKWWQREWASHHAFRCLPPTVELGQQMSLGASLRPPTITEKVAACLTKIGFEKARAVGKCFRSPLEMCLADVKQWQSVPGVGKVLAERIVRELTEP